MGQAHLRVAFALVLGCLIAPGVHGQEATDGALKRVAALIEQASALHPQKQAAQVQEAVKKAYEAASKLPDANSRADVQDLLWKLGFVALKARDLRTAHDSWQSVLAYRLRTLPDDHRDLQSARGNLALTKRNLGDPKGALALEEKVLEVRKRNLPDDHPRLQAARQNLAATRSVLGDLEGALALKQKVLEVQLRNLPDDHPDLQEARINLGNALLRMGDSKGALVLLQKACDICTETLADDHPLLQGARQNLAAAKTILGDLKGALALKQKVFEVESRMLPDDHPHLQEARVNLGNAKQAKGDLKGATALFQEALDVWSRTLPDDHRHLQKTRINLAGAKRSLGDLRGALALYQKVFDVASRTLPDDDFLLQHARQNLAATKADFGDLKGALALEQKVLEAFSRSLPDDHPDLQRARQNLAATMYALGDLKGALALQQKVLDIRSRVLPDDHPDLQTSRHDLATTIAELGDWKGALPLLQKVLDARSRALPDDHPDLQSSRQNLAVVMHDLGDLKRALALEQKVLDVQTKSLPDDHPDLQSARNNLALTLIGVGELERALALQHKVFEVRSSALPDDHPDLQTARRNLIWTAHGLGRETRATTLAQDWLLSGRQAMSTWSLSPRQQGSLAALWLPACNAGLTLAIECEAAAAVLTGDVLLATESLRGIEVRSARRARLAVLANKAEEVNRLRARIRRASARLAAGQRRTVPRDHPEAERELESLRDEQHAALVEKESAEQDLATLVKAVGGLDYCGFTTKELADKLTPGTAAASVIRYTHGRLDPKTGKETRERRMVALCLNRQGGTDLVPLGPAEGIDKLASALRALHGGKDTRSPKPPGRPLRTIRTDERRLMAQLSELVLAPILKAVGEVDTLYISVDEALGLVPLDALPDKDGTPIGQSLRVVPVLSLFELTEPRRAEVASRAGRRLLIVGDVNYNATGKTDDQPTEGRLTTVDHSPLAAAPALPESTRAGPDHYLALPGTKAEVEELQRLFAASFEAGITTFLSADRASKLPLQKAMRDANFVHIASHGYFAPEEVASTLDDSHGRPAELMGQIKRQIQGLSPLVLTGLALSGANSPADELGYTDGIITAEEILPLDLTSCELATLSACNTSLGIHRAGQGYASLRAALQGAGARYVLTSLWKVGDENTRKLMTDFYRRMWQDDEPPRQALWQAKMKARKDGMPFRDWAGWVMTGI